VILMTSSVVKGESQSIITKKVVVTLPSKKHVFDMSNSVFGQSRPRITIWIHGTKSMGAFSEFTHGSPEGLMAVSQLPFVYRMGRITKVLSQADPKSFPLEHFYVFGWSGTLAFDERKAQAEKLYALLKKMNLDYETLYGVKPEITLITHSHGGNVALNLAAVKDEDCDLTVAAILLACPVQHETKKLVNDPFFSKVYSFYSTSDFVQILDPQGLYKTEMNCDRHVEFSARQFPASTNLRQARLKINGYGIMHVGFTFSRFVSLLPDIIHHTDEWMEKEPNEEGHERVLDIVLPEKKSWFFALPVNVDAVSGAYSKLKNGLRADV